MFEPGNQLAKLGKRAKRITATIERAIEQDDGAKLRRGIDRLLDAFAAGEPWAIEQVWNRLEGKPAQSISVTGDEDSHVTIQAIRMVVVQSQPDTNQALTIEHETGSETDSDKHSYLRLQGNTVPDPPPRGLTGTVGRGCDEPPPLSTQTGNLLQSVQTSNSSFIPLSTQTADSGKAQRRREYQANWQREKRAMKKLKEDASSN